MVKVFPSMKPVHKEWEKRLFLQMQNTHQKAHTRHIKKGITAQSKEQNKALQNDLKETELWIICQKNSTYLP